MKLTHLDGEGAAHMVDVGNKDVTTRTAVATAEVHMRESTLRLITNGELPKGDVFSCARIAGIMAAKKTSELIPMCHEMCIRDSSRGDESGTHKAELKIWKAAELDPSKDSWYVSAGAGMGACLNQASESKAYVLTDKGTYLSMKDNLDLDILLEKSDEMKNTYSLIAVNPEKNEGINKEGAEAFIKWMTSEKALKLIAEYGKDKYGEALFYILEK